MMRWQWIIHLAFFLLLLHFPTNPEPAAHLPPSFQAGPTALHPKVRKKVCLINYCHDKIYKWSFYIHFSRGMSIIFGVRAKKKKKSKFVPALN
jgi:hypothetical protein